MKLTIIVIYGALFSFFFVIFALFWHAQMADVYFVCRSKGVIADFVPPFVQSGDSGDIYLKPPHVVYTIWLVYAGCAAIIPAVFSWLLVRIYQRAQKKAWMW